MATRINATLAQALESLHLLEPGQLQEVTQQLQTRFPSAAALAGELVRRGWLTSFQADKLLAGRGRELRLGPYLLLDRLGQGGMGEVYKARLQSTGKIVALKVLRPELTADAEAVARFHREMEVAGRLRHPCLVRASDAGQVDSAQVLEMEYLEGIDLEALVRKSGPLPIHPACDYIRQAALGLQHASKLGLVHRDIKPANLFVCKYRVEDSSIGSTPFGVIKLFDLGLARLQEPPPGSPTRNLTQMAGAGSLQGTPDYMAPEQAIDFHNADTRSDIYSLGCTFYFLLTGKPPFSGTLAEKLIKHQQVMPQPIEQVRDNVPPALANVVKKMLAKNPADRYQTPGEVAQALDNVIRNLRQSGPRNLGARSATSGSCDFLLNGPLPLGGPVPEGRSRRRGLLLAGAGVAAIVLVGLIGWFSRQSDPSPPPSSPTAAVEAEVHSRPPINVGAGPSGPLKTGQGRLFNRADQAVTVPHQDALEPAELTLTAWIKLADYPKGRRWVVGKNENEGKPGHYALVVDGRKLIVYYSLGAGKEDLQQLSTGDVLQLQRWHLLTLTCDGKVLRGYLDGEPFAEQKLEKPRQTGKAALVIGRRPDQAANSHFLGRLDDVRLYDRVLSPEEIRSLYRHPDVAVKKGEGGLVYRWP